MKDLSIGCIRNRLKKQLNLTIDNVYMDCRSISINDIQNVSKKILEKAYAYGNYSTARIYLLTNAGDLHEVITYVDGEVEMDLSNINSEVVYSSLYRKDPKGRALPFFLFTQNTAGLYDLISVFPSQTKNCYKRKSETYESLIR